MHSNKDTKKNFFFRQINKLHEEFKFDFLFFFQIISLNSIDKIVVNHWYYWFFPFKSVKVRHVAHGSLSSARFFLFKYFNLRSHMIHRHDFVDGV